MLKTFHVVRRKFATLPERGQQAPLTLSRKWFDASLPLTLKDAKSFDVVKSGDVVVDYSNVKLKGYLSAFRSPAEGDRDGEYVIPGAFAETIKQFTGANRLPLLRDHRNMTDSLAGSFDVLREDATGLYVEASLSNAPDNASTRFKVAEGHLQTLSIGGVFHFNEDGRGIFKVALYEGSLTPVPADPKAVISTRSLSEQEWVALSAKSFFPSAMPAKPSGE